MAGEDEAPRPRQSVQARVAALQSHQLGRTPADGRPPVKPPRPSQGGTPPPQPWRLSAARPSVDVRRQSANHPPLRQNGTAVTRQIGTEPSAAKTSGVLPPPSIQRTTSSEASLTPKPSPPPRLPARKESVGPVLPPRRPSEPASVESRRASRESTSSGRPSLSSISAMSIAAGTTSTSRSPSTEIPNGRIKAPAYDPATLPPLPRKRSEAERMVKPARTAYKPAQSSPLLPTRAQAPPAAEAGGTVSPARPPRLPARTPSIPQSEPVRRVRAPELPSAMPRRSALSLAMNKATEEPPPLPSARPSLTNSATPPPVPLASRPSAAQLQASNPGSTASSCLKCRDFSLPDAHAARFPRQSIPSTSTAWLSNALTSPFPSPADKARAIFVWLHHNIAYDTGSFFAGNVKPSTPASTVQSGLAVCEGYAALLCALATAAGLECVVLGGHGKGFGFSTLPPGAPIPAYSAGHAWNAVKLPDTRPDVHQGWKLIDPCWGAGHVDGASRSYTASFNAAHFTMSNVEFGHEHFPDDRRSFFREDGRTPSWETYFLGDVAGGGEAVQIFTAAPATHGLAESSFQPPAKHVPVSGGGTVRFGFTKTCPHYDHLTMGPKPGAPYCFTLAVQGGQTHLPLEYDAQQGRWWIDVPRAQLGAPGSTVGLNALTVVDGRDARGMDRAGFFRVWGRKSLAWEGLGTWTLV